MKIEIDEKKVLEGQVAYLLSTIMDLTSQLSKAQAVMNQLAAKLNDVPDEKAD